MRANLLRPPSFSEEVKLDLQPPLPLPFFSLTLPIIHHRSLIYAYTYIAMGIPLCHRKMVIWCDCNAKTPDVRHIMVPIQPIVTGSWEYFAGKGGGDYMILLLELFNNYYYGITHISIILQTNRYSEIS